MTARNQKNHQGSTCAIRGSLGPETRDHIPPKAIFDKPLPGDLLTIPACLKCNGGASRDDEYFRNGLCLSNHRGSDRYGLAGGKRAIRSIKRSKIYDINVGTPESYAKYHGETKSPMKRTVLDPRSIVKSSAFAKGLVKYRLARPDKVCAASVCRMVYYISLEVLCLAGNHEVLESTARMPNFLD